MNSVWPIGPAVLSFSGGRTSGYMLRRWLDAAPLTREQFVVFANTGLEEPETLDFVAACAHQWRVPVVWLEYRAGRQFEQVSYETASRNGEPFSALVSERRFLPNPVARFCTAELKVRTIERWAATQLALVDGFDSALGIRADEPRRVARIRGRKAEGAADVVMPLAALGVGVGEVVRFWREQPFDLRLSTDGKHTSAGNCALCFLKPARQLVSLIHEKPHRAAWWIRTEAQVGGTFRSDRPDYATLASRAGEADLFDPAEELAACFCGDDA
jgi:3'-phosphoadenosine 5'-phosphosulfate sulfotransferase (PAPS reductase)/FAD synthetase